LPVVCIDLRCDTQTFKSSQPLGPVAMSNQIGGDEIAQFIDKAANFEAPSGVSVVVEFEDGTTMNHTWGAVEATPESTPEQSETTTPEQGEAEIRDAWAKIAADEWQKFQSAAAEFGVTTGKRPERVDKLVDLGVMPGDDPSGDTSDDAPEQSEPESFKDLSEDKQDELRDAVDTDPSETDYKQAKSLLETGADYLAIAGECLNHAAHAGEAVGANLTRDGIIPFCNHCENKADGVTVERLSDTEQTIFAALRNDGMVSSKALVTAEN